MKLLFLLTIALTTSIGETHAVEDGTYSRPNILMAIADDVSFPHMGAYGYTWVHTPAFDEVANNGLLFQNAFTPNAKCAPSRAIILTGRNSWQLEAAANHVPYFPKKFKTVFESLKEQGYLTGHVAKGYAPGDPGMINGKRRQLVGPAYNEIQTSPPTQSISKIDYAANFEIFLKNREKGQPFCFWYGSLEPHRSYEYGSGQRLGGKSTSELDSIFSFFPDVDSVRQDFLDYAFEIEYFDSHLQKMMALLNARGELENTLILVTADNGMPFPRIKGQVYEASNHLPLAIMWQKEIIDPGRTIREFVSFTDFAPTILDAAGINWEQTGMQTFEGQSLLQLFKNQKQTNARTHILVGKERHDVGRPNDWGYPVRGIRTGDYLFLVNFKPDRWPAGNPETGYLNCDGSPTKSVILHQRRSQNEDFYWTLAFGKRTDEELYQLAKDPGCMINLVEHPDYTKVRDSLRNQLFFELGQQGDPRIIGEGFVFDAYPYANEAQRNFYYRYHKGELQPKNAGWVNEDDFEENKLVTIGELFFETIEQNPKTGKIAGELKLIAVFTKPDGMKINASGFYDDQKLWKFQIKPDQLGLWKYDVRFSDATRGKNGTFEVIATR